MSDLGVYVLDSKARPKKLAECDDDCLGFCLKILTEEGQIERNSEVGVLDLHSRAWIINPWPPSPFGRRTA